MAIDHYRIRLLEFRDVQVRFEPDELLDLLKKFRKGYHFATCCSECKNSIEFGKLPYGTCCQRFYYNDKLFPYPVMPIALRTPRYAFLLRQLKILISKARHLVTDQEYVVLPDPIFWQVKTTLVYERVVKFIRNLPMTRRATKPVDASNVNAYYEQVLKAPLNYGSLAYRSCGKYSLMRQMALGKRCKYSMRGMIVPDATLKPNEIRLPDSIVEQFDLKGKWVLLNRMPSLQPENFVGLRVPDARPSWPHDCFGLPLEILESINGDFDGDEANVYLIPSLLAQAECATILNPECSMRSFVMGGGTKLSPCQDMLVAYHLYYDEVDFLPYKTRDLKATLRVICELYGDAAAFEAFDRMRLFYLDRLQNRTCFALTLSEMIRLSEILEAGGDVRSFRCCLTTQILSGAKGNFQSLVQMFGSVGLQSGVSISSSFLKGLTGLAASAHGQTALLNQHQLLSIWQPGYGYAKVIANAHELHVTYAGTVTDAGKRIVFLDALDAYHYEDVLSSRAFMHIFRQTISRRKRKADWEVEAAAPKRRKANEREEAAASKKRKAKEETALKKRKTNE